MTLVAVEAQATAPLDVFESKLRVPVARPGTVSRTAVVNRLRAEGSARLATVVAAPGFGKTTLLAQWAARDERPFAWVSIDERDNDPLVLLRHVAAAFEHVEQLPASLLDAFAAPGPSVWAAAAPRLAAALSSCRRPFVLVLDGADVIRAGDAADAVIALADHIPEGSMLVLAGRVQPPVPVARLRARGELLELGTRELALSRRESMLVLREAGLKLDEEDAADLLERTEGWAAGLYLAALAFDDAGPAQGAAAFDGGDRYVSEYFRSEQLAALTPEQLAFLRRTSVLDRLSGPICDAVLESHDSAAGLDALADATLFLVPLDRNGGWYRCHHLFRDALRRELRLTEPELGPALQERAADWYEGQDDLESALDHAESSGNTERAARLLTTVAYRAFHTGRITTVEAWVERFAAHAPLEAYPAVAVLGGFVHALRGRAEDAEAWLRIAEQGPPDGPLPDGCTSVRPWIALLRAALCTEGVEPMERDVDSALAELASESSWLPIALVLHGVVATLRGERERADERFAAAAEAAELGATDAGSLALAERALLAVAAGDHSASERLATEAVDLLESGVDDEAATGSIVRAAAARAVLRHGRLDARRQLTAAELQAAFLGHALPWLAVETRLALGAAYVSLRDRDRATAHLEEIERVLALRPDVGVLRDRAGDLRRDIAELPDGRDGHRAGLTDAELRLLPLLTTHLSFGEIGERLYVSRNTIKTQAISTYRKLGVSSRSDAIERASELGLVDVVSPLELIRAG